MVLIFGLGISVAFAAGILHLPPIPVAVEHGTWNHGSDSTIDITLSGVPSAPTPGYHVTNGTYSGWCLEDNHQDDVPSGSLVTLLDSTDENPLFCEPGDFPGVPWDEINFLLNHQQGSMGDIQATIEDIQAAMWIVAGTNDPVSPIFPETPEVTALVLDAQTYGPGFIPCTGEVVAVILCSDGLGPDPYQDTIIEVPLSNGCTPGFWKHRIRFSNWSQPIDPASTTFFEVFDVVPSAGDVRLSAALRKGGNGENALMRHASAAYLNALSLTVDYFCDADEVIAIVQNAYGTGDFDTATTRLKTENERGGPCLGPERRTSSGRFPPG
jgi:hypothetical protein